MAPAAMASGSRVVGTGRACPKPVSFARWLARPSRGTAGRSRSRPGSGWRCTSRRPAAARSTWRWPASAPTATVVHRAPQVEADDHPTRRRRVEQRVRLAGGRSSSTSTRPGARATTRCVLDVDVDGRTTASHAFFVVRPAAGAPSAPILLGARHEHLARLQRLRRPEPLQRRHPRVAPAADGARATSTSRRAPAAGSPPRHPPDPQMAAHVGYLRLNHLSGWAGSAGWPDWELPFVQWAEREGYDLDVATNADLEDHPAPRRRRYRLLLSVGHDEYWSGPMRDTVEALHRRRRQRRLPLGQHRRSGRCALEDRRRGPGHRWSGTRAASTTTPVYRHRPAARAHDHVVGPPARPARERT